MKVHLPLVEDAVPKFFKPMKVPLAFKEKVEVELDRLERNGIIIKTTMADLEWGTPLVLVLKKDSSIRLCTDYRVTANPFLKDDHHPLPIIDEIFSALQGGKPFFQARSQECLQVAGARGRNEEASGLKQSPRSYSSELFAVRDEDCILYFSTYIEANDCF